MAIARSIAALRRARPVLLNLGGPGRFGLTASADRVQLVNAEYDGPWELPAIGQVAAPAAVLIRPDGYVAWVGDERRVGLAEALTTWFGPLRNSPRDNHPEGCNHADTSRHRPRGRRH